MTHSYPYIPPKPRYAPGAGDQGLPEYDTCPYCERRTTEEREHRKGCPRQRLSPVAPPRQPDPNAPDGSGKGGQW